MRFQGILAQHHPRSPSQRKQYGFRSAQPIRRGYCPEHVEACRQFCKNPFELHPISSARQSTPTAALRVSPMARRKTRD